ncbi:HLH-domain-containing protein [Xylona heveae TC161]|uniref:HLH-domain-containing protein n=1 Tax=Xylona heveae (strain CBS 132557 / TC161) TaxID=1328760 RepID=A0A165HLG5_XYLHT|nr:HLH-domain-containing protein [Xylona heveae TC161]KZF23693.1 HLH-domain-containing protein [Xylona heveae TC161]
MENPTARMPPHGSLDVTMHSAPQIHTQLPGINDLTAGISARGHPGDSPTYTNDANGRDSGNWSLQSPSKHSSIVSNGASGFQLPPLNSRPSPIRSTSGQGDRSPYSGNLSAGVPPSVRQQSPSQGPPSEQVHSGLPSLTQPYDAQQRGSMEFSPQESRRSSVDSRVNSGMNQLAITPSSPYATSNNASQASLVSNLQRERGILNDQGRNGISIPRLSSQQQLSPLGPHGSEGRMRTRIAPPISANPRAEYGIANPNAENPTKGFSYAFPDPAVTGRSSESDDGDRSSLTRRDSYATSITSSIYTNDSRMPPGQRRFDDEPLPGVHHHRLQHRQVSDLVGGGHGGTPSPYSRTPELRNSHKLAERKRRSEMKDLFEELRLQLPSHQGAKSSKWEILTKATEYIKQLETSLDRSQHESKEYLFQFRQSEEHFKDVRLENERLRESVQHLQQQISHFGVPPTPSYQPTSSSFGNPNSQPGRTVLPPLGGPAPSNSPARHSSSHAPHLSSSMQGVQYSSDRL